MGQDIMKSLEESGAPAREFWKDDLEMALEHVLVRSGQDGFMDEWIGRRTGRQISVLCANLGIDGTGSVRQRKNALRSSGNDDLLPYLLVDQFAKYKSKVATIDFAKGVLADDVLETCRKSDEEFDTTALLFAVYHNRKSDLRLLFHLDKIHKSGFARMKLRDTVRRPEQNFQEFLQPETVKDILDGFDQVKGDGRTSEFKDVVIHDGHHLVLQSDIETVVKKKLGLPIDREDIIQTCRWKGRGEGDHGYRINPFTVAGRPFRVNRS